MTTPLLNPVEKRLVEAELSDAELYRLAYLAYRITSEDLPTPGGFSRSDTSQWIDKMRFRSAPSIVVRSEAELFGINMPRFAYRAIFAENSEQASFVNLRRVESFVSNVGRRLELGPRDEFISQLRRKCRSVADSFLAVPAWAKDYHVITTDLSKWYSEEGPKQGTPFVTHFPVGGGMCAQAVCFMVSALLHQHSSGVYGVSEVTMQSTSGDDSDQRFLNFSGLTLERMKTFFWSIKLCPKSQFSDNVEDFRNALRAYLLSGIPVIIPVDMRKLRENVYTQFPFSPQESNADAKSIQRHVVLAIGALKHDAGDGDDLEFLIHDPATYPFLRASARQLFDAGASLGDKSASPYLFPVSPKEISPLLTVKAAEAENPKREGIIWQSRKALQLNVSSKPRYAWCQVAQIIARKCPRLFQSEWEWDRLIECLSNYSFNDSWAQVPTQFSDRAVVTIWNVVGAEEIDIQFSWNSREQVWEPLNESASAFRRSTNPEALLPADRGDAPDESGPRLKASLITSFSLSGAKDVRELLTNEGIHVPIEQYIWMQKDVDEVIQNYVGSNFKSLSLRDKLNLTAVDALALLSPGKPLLKNVVDAYLKMAPNTVAIATFIPELAAHPESERAELARYAITTLGWLALSIRKRQMGDHKLSRIELVGGSRIGRVYQSMPSSGTRIELIAEVQPLAAVHLNIAENLRIAMESDSNLLKQLKQNGVAFALEEEPGPLFALGNIKALSDFCRSFLDDPRYALIKGVVGLNADLAHWVMSRDVKEYLESVRHRIVHAHISGHHPTSHFGDTELTCELAERYRPLMSFLRQLLKEDECEVRRKSGLPQFSGYISLEYEAAPSLKSIERSLECVEQIL